MKSKGPSESKKNMKKKNPNITTFDEFKDEYFGKRGTKKREKYEKGFKAFEIGVMLQQARLDKGLTQEQVAKKCGTTKSYISKIENNIKEARYSTLEKIVEIGLGGHLHVSIEL